MKQILDQLFDNKILTRDEAFRLMSAVADFTFNDSQLSSLMTVYRMRPITADELRGFRDAILQRQVPVKLDSDSAIDIVGTGGDGKNTFNISTAACFVVAGAGYRVIKHGNYSSSSVSGASNALEHFGVRFTADSGQLSRSLDECGMAYLHAPLFSPALKSVGAARRSIGVRTFFNCLGPLVNPCRPKNQLLGVSSLELMRMYAYLLHGEGVNATIVHSLDGYDEISLTRTFKVVGRRGERLYEPREIGMSTCRESDLYGGATRPEAASIFMNVLSGTSTLAQRQCVVANAAFAILTLNQEIGLDQAISQANESLDSHRALDVFKKFVEINS